MSSSPPLAAGVEAADVVEEVAVAILVPPKLNPVAGEKDEVVVTGLAVEFAPNDGAELTPNEKPGLMVAAPLKSFLEPDNAAPNPNEGGDPLPNPVAIGGEA